MRKSRFSEDQIIGILKYAEQTTDGSAQFSSPLSSDDKRRRVHHARAGPREPPLRANPFECSLLQREKMRKTRNR